MGHYDDVIDRIQQKELEERALRNNRTIEEQWFYEDKYLPAKKLVDEHERRKKELQEAREIISKVEGKDK